MKKYLLSLTVLVAASSLSLSAKSKLNAHAQVCIDYYKQLQQNPKANLFKPLNMPFEINPISRSETFATVFVTMADGVTANDITAQGLNVLSQAGNIVIATGSINDIASLGETDLVKNIAFGGEAKATTYHARQRINMDAIHNGTDGLSQAYDGTGVICGLYDIGFDAHHPNFNKRDDKSTSRVQKVWTFVKTDGSYTEYSGSSLDNLTTDSSSAYHGTHVAGCMAGGYNEKPGTSNTFAFMEDEDSTPVIYNAFQKSMNNPYYGMAPGAELAVSCGQLYETNISVGISKVVEYAKSVNKPLVLNLSLGKVTDSHDEYDPETAYLDEIAKDAIVCVSAGNDGDGNLSIVKQFTANDSQTKFFLSVDTSVGYGTLTFYSDDDTKFTLTPFIYDYNALNDDGITFSTDITQNTIIANETGSGVTNSAAFSGAFENSALEFEVDDHANTSKRYSVTLSYKLQRNSTSNVRSTKILGFIAKGQPGHKIFITNFQSYGNVAFSTEGFDDCDVAGADFSINGYACGKNTICVGAFNTISKVPTIGGLIMSNNSDAFDQGKISNFTSYGTLYDGRNLPHICSPGTDIISSVNSYYSNTEYTDRASAKVTANGRSYYWHEESGTSMASPILAGALATWCQAYPQLTGTQAREIIIETAIQDEYTRNWQNKVQCGAGKFNALGGLKKLLGLDGVADIAADHTDVIVTGKGYNVYEAFVAGAKTVNAQIYNLSGQLVDSVKANADSVDIDASHLAKGIYVLRVNNNYSQRIAIQ